MPEVAKRSTARAGRGHAPRRLVTRTADLYVVAANGRSRRSRSSCVPRGEDAEMKWTKPEFEIVDLCLEVTTYVYRR
jgi:coenzyme PQQ precursor peptide PqqA